jgi:uncharacterized protein
MSEALRNLYLVVAQECNLACAYCYAGGGGFGQAARHMGEATLRRGLERLLPLAGERLTLSFFGGEPLLNFPLVRRAIELADRLARDTGRVVSYALTTNGTLLDEEILSVLKDRIAHLAISLDGDAAASRGRVFRDGAPAFAAIMANLERLRERGIPFGLRATVTPDNVGQAVETVDFLAGLGPVSVRLLPAQGIAWPAESRRRLGEAMAALNRRGLQAMLAGGQPQACEHAYRLVAHRAGGEAATRPCLAGGGVLALAADGRVYPCEHFVGVAAMAMGHVGDDEFPGSRYREVAARFTGCATAVRPRCAECGVKEACGGQCYAEAWRATGDIARPAADHCALVRKVHRALEADLVRGLAEPAGAARLREAVGA